MAIKIEISIDTITYDKEVADYMDFVFDPAIAEGINATAFLVQGQLVSSMKTAFDNPTPFTLAGIGVYPIDPTNPKDSDGVATVFVKPLQAQYLELEIDGGVRAAGDYATTKVGPLIPGPHARLNRYGNLPQGYVASILAQPHTAWVKLGKNAKYWSLVRRAPGPGGKLEILAFALDKEDYKPRFDFYGIAKATAAQHMAEQVALALDRAGRLVKDG